MRRWVIYSLILLFLLPIVSPVPHTQAQDGVFQSGDWVLTTDELTVYAQADFSSTQVTRLPESLLVRIIREPLVTEEGQWFYIGNHAFAWVFQPLNTSILMPYTDTLADKLLNQHTLRIEENPQDYDAYRLRAFMYYNLQEYIKAAEDMLVYVDSVEFTQTGFWQGWIGKFYMDTNAPELLREADTILFSAQIGPGGSDDLMIGVRRALLEDQANLVMQTSNFYEGATRRAPDWALLYNNWGIRFAGTNDGQAQNLYEQAIAIDPEFSSAYISLGNVYERQGDYATAIDYYTLAIETNPFGGFAYVRRADAYISLSQINNAVDDYLTAIEVEPDNSRIRGWFGAYHLRNGNFRQALEQIDIAIELAPNNLGAYVNKSIAHSYLGEYEEAAEAIEVALVLNNTPNADLSVEFRAAEVFLKLDRYEDAEQPLRLFVNCCANPSDTPWWAIASVMLGRVQVQLGKYDEALLTYEKAFNFNANVSLNYMNWVSNYRQVVVVTDEDVRRAQRAVDDDPNNAELYFELGKEQLELGYWTAAIASFRTYDVLADDVPDEFNDFVDELENIVLRR